MDSGIHIALPGLSCTECGQRYGGPHLGTCSGSLMHGGTGIVGLMLPGYSWHADGAPILAEEKQTGFPGSKEGVSE